MLKHEGLLLAVLLFCATALPAAAKTNYTTYRGGPRHGDLRALANEAEQLSDRFRQHLNRELDRTIVDGTKVEKQLKRRAANLENALDDLRSRVNNGRNLKDTRKSVSLAVKFSTELDRDLARLRLSPGLRNEWRNLTARVEQLAYYYELNPVRGR